MDLDPKLKNILNFWIEIQEETKILESELNIMDLWGGYLIRYEKSC
jgi:hypothetical protein